MSSCDEEVEAAKGGGMGPHIVNVGEGQGGQRPQIVSHGWSGAGYWWPGTARAQPAGISSRRWVLF